MENMDVLFQVTGPTPVKQEEIVVTINPSLMVDDFAVAIVREAERKAPLIFKEQPLDVDEMKQLCRAILALRVAYVRNYRVDWRRMKLINIPDFIQLSISMVGQVIIKESGIKLTPDYDFADDSNKFIIPADGQPGFDMDKILAWSHKLDAYSEYLHMTRDAFPRSTDGNLDVMSTALINDYVRGLQRATHPADTYVSAFLGFTLKQEVTFQILYRINYDDIDYVKTSIEAMNRRLI